MGLFLLLFMVVICVYGQIGGYSRYFGFLASSTQTFMSLAVQLAPELPEVHLTLVYMALT